MKYDNNKSALNLMITKDGVRWVVDDDPAPALPAVEPDPSPAITSPDPAPSRNAGGTDRPRVSRFRIVFCIVTAVTVAFLFTWQHFVGSLSGYTRENMIPPPPDRTVGASADTETEAAVVSLPEPPETSVTLSTPEAAEVTAPAETAPAPSELPAEVIPLEPDGPSETTLEEWFALMEERTRHTPAYPDEDETTLDEWFAKVEAEAAGTARWYTVNTSTKKIHNDWCKEVQKIKPENIDYTDTPGELLADGYTWCEKCHKQ